MIGFLLPFIFLFYFASLNFSYEFEDALIYLRYIRNFSEGNGLVYNKGEFYNGITSPLYSYILILFSYLTKNFLFLQNAISAVFHFLLIGMFYKLYSRKDFKIYSIFFSGIFLSVSYYFYSLYGLETLQFLFLILLCLYLFEKEDYLKLGISSALLILTRSEGVFLLLAMFIEHLRLKRKFPDWRYFIIPAFLFLLHYSFNQTYYGHLFPDSASAKIYHGKSDYWGKWPKAFLIVFYHLPMFFGNKIEIVIITISIGLFGYFKQKLSSIAIIATEFVIFYSAFFIFLNIPNYHWYYAPHYLFIFIYCGLGFGFLLKSSLAVKNLFIRSILVSLVSCLLIFLLYQNIMHTKSSVGKVNLPYKNAGLWIKQNTDENAKVAAVEIGTIGWYSERPIIDILGLVSPINAKLIGEKKYSAWLDYYNPDYILAHEELWKFEEGISRVLKEGRFEEEKAFTISGLKLYKRKY